MKLNVQPPLALSLQILSTSKKLLHTVRSTLFAFLPPLPLLLSGGGSGGGLFFLSSPNSVCATPKKQNKHNSTIVQHRTRSPSTAHTKITPIHQDSTKTRTGTCSDFRNTSSIRMLATSAPD